MTTFALEFCSKFLLLPVVLVPPRPSFLLLLNPMGKEFHLMPTFAVSVNVFTDSSSHGTRIGKDDYAPHLSLEGAPSLF
jgi:hypothetical protein